MATNPTSPIYKSKKPEINRINFENRIKKIYFHYFIIGSKRYTL